MPISCAWWGLNATLAVPGLNAGPKVMRRSCVRVRFAVASVEPSPAENRTNFQTGLTLPEEMTTNLTWYEITSCLNVSPAQVGSGEDGIAMSDPNRSRSHGDIPRSLSRRSDEPCQ